MVGTGAISLFGAATQWLIMTILGIPYALPLAVLAVFGGFIPYIGSLITTGLAFLVTVATGSPTDIVIMAIFTIVFNIVQGNFVAPIVYSKVVSLHPAVVLVAIPAGNEIAGVIGMFLVVPFLGVFAAVWRTVLRVLDTSARSSPLQPPAPADAAPEPGLSTAPSGSAGPRPRPGQSRTWNGAGRTPPKRPPDPRRRVSLVAGSDPECLGLGCGELLVGQDALVVELGELLELGRCRIDRRRRPAPAHRPAGAGRAAAAACCCS